MARIVHVQSVGRAGRCQSGAARRGVVWAVVTVLLVVGAGIGAYLAWFDGDDNVATRPGGSASTNTTEPPEPGLELSTPPEAAETLEGIDESDPVSAVVLKRTVATALASPKLGPHVAFAVGVLGDNAKPVELGAPGAVTPASTTKLLTTTATLELLGPDHRFTTSVVQGADPRSLVLVGGGDPLLTTTKKAASTLAEYPGLATLQALARQTAKSLHSKGIRTIKLGYDASLFVGPTSSPAWESTYISASIVSPISALWVDEGRVSPGAVQRVADPALAAAQKFAAQLRKHGVDVDSDIAPARATNGTHEVAAVSSPPLAEIVQHILDVSDNEGAEVLLRQAGLAGGEAASFAGGVRAVRTTLRGLGVDMAGAVFYDGSGLSRQDEVMVPTLVETIQTAASTEHDELRAVITGLPVAGFTGSLADRFVDDAPTGLGVVRAKTGTLTGVHALAGLAQTKQGTVLVFAAVANDVPVPKTLDARAQLDRVAAALSGCRC